MKKANVCFKMNEETHYQRLEVSLLTKNNEKNAFTGFFDVWAHQFYFEMFLVSTSYPPALTPGSKTFQ